MFCLCTIVVFTLLSYNTSLKSLLQQDFFFWLLIFCCPVLNLFLFLFMYKSLHSLTFCWFVQTSATWSWRGALPLMNCVNMMNLDPIPIKNKNVRHGKYVLFFSTFSFSWWLEHHLCRELAGRVAIECRTHCLAHLYQVVLSVCIVWRTKFGFEYLRLINCGLVPWVNRQHCCLLTHRGCMCFSFKFLLCRGIYVQHIL